MKVQRLTLETTFVEYNRDTSAERPLFEDDDIVRHSFEKRRVLGKELVQN